VSEFDYADPSSRREAIILFALLGSAITFYPGSESPWFVTCGLLIVPGVFVPKRGDRVVAVIAGGPFFFYAYALYYRGIGYQQWRQSRPEIEN
jgi:hypothetical protein